MHIVPLPGLLLLQVIPFLVTFLVLHHVLFKPMMAYLDEREQAIHGVAREARELAERAEQGQRELESRLVEARRQAAAERARLHESAARERQELLEAARREADQLVQSALAELQAETDRAREQLRLSSRDLARALAARALGRALEAGEA